MSTIRQGEEKLQWIFVGVYGLTWQPEQFCHHHHSYHHAGHRGPRCVDRHSSLLILRSLHAPPQRRVVRECVLMSELFSSHAHDSRDWVTKLQQKEKEKRDMDMRTLDGCWTDNIPSIFTTAAQACIGRDRENINGWSEENLSGAPPAGMDAQSQHRRRMKSQWHA